MNPHLAVYLHRASHLRGPSPKLPITSAVLNTLRPIQRTKDFFRPRERYGDMWLSVQASETHYCTPRVSGLPLDQYSAVEIALVGRRNDFFRPSDLGIPGFDNLFDEKGRYPVAGYVPRGKVDDLRMCLMIRAARLKGKPTRKPRAKAKAQRLQGSRSRAAGYSRKTR